MNIYEEESLEHVILYDANKDPLDIHNSLELDRVECGNGIRMYFKGKPYPMKGMPTPETTHAIAVAKKILLGRPLEAAKIALQPYFRKNEYLSPCPREIVRIWPNRLGKIIAHILEYDSSYRARIQDMLSESDQYRLAYRPIQEIWRMVKINKRRDYSIVHRKFVFFAWGLTVALLWPPFRFKWRKGILACNYVNLCLDEGDRFWLDKRTDYHSKA